MVEVHMATIVAEAVSKKFDKIAEKSFRSRADHLRFLIEKEIEYHETKEADKK